MNYEFDWSSIPGSLPFLWEGMKISLEITAIAVVVGIVWGTLLAMMRLSSVKPLSWFAAGYVNLFRAVPLVMVLLWFFLIVPRFIEYMDVGNHAPWSMADTVPSAELVATLCARWPLEAVPAQYPGEVASRFRFLDGQGEIGVISSISQPFCGDCSRARLSSDGTLWMPARMISE